MNKSHQKKREGSHEKMSVPMALQRWVAVSPVIGAINKARIFCQISEPW